MSTPVSVNDGLKRADGKTWAVLGGAAVVAIVIVAAVALFVPKPEVKWPDSPKPASDEPNAYEVAPPQSVPPVPG